MTDLNTQTQGGDGLNGGMTNPAIQPIQGRGFWFKLGIPLLILVILAGAAWWQLNSLMSPVAPGQKKDVLFNVPQGISTTKIASILKQEGLIKSPLAFRLYARYKGLDGKLRAGEYMLSPSMSLPQIAGAITKGDVNLYKITIPEGYTTAQIADLLERKRLVDKKAFLQEIASGDFSEFTFLMNLPNGDKRLEGYLFPDTYNFDRGMKEKDIIRGMLKHFGKSIPVDYEDKASRVGLSISEAVTLASIIEKEAKKDEDRPMVSAVFHNRLKKGMFLQSDATVVYALGQQKERILYKDLKIESPYNTYLHPGLPIGPIDSPGLPSLLAAVEPANVDYLFFVSLYDGKVIYASSWGEHQKNIKEYKDRFLKP